MSTTQSVYLDTTSTTPIDPRVLRAMMPYFRSSFGNPGSIHRLGVEAQRALDGARKAVAGLFSGLADEIVFTGSGTESNNLAIFGVIRNLERLGRNIRRMHVVTSAIEHSSVLEPLRALELEGLMVTYLGVDSHGVVNIKELKKSLRRETVLVSVQYANNEIGTIQPIREIAKTIRHSEKNITYLRGQPPLFHVDASQAALYLDMHAARLGAQLISIDGHKMYGPKGVGALYVKRGTSLRPIIHGGGQERGLRAGTENLPGIVGLSKAVEIGKVERESEVQRLSVLRDTTLQEIKIIIPGMVLNGHPTERLANNINISIPDMDSEFLTLQLDAKGIQVSTKSTCMRDTDDSYVVAALKGEKWRATHSLRVTVGRQTNLAQIKFFLRVLKTIVGKRH